MSDPAYDVVRVQVNQTDVQALHDRGITRPWYINSSGNVTVRLPNGRPVPVAALIMNNCKGQRVVFRDGNPLNLRRVNLILVEADVAHG